MEGTPEKRYEEVRRNFKEIKKSYPLFPFLRRHLQLKTEDGQSLGELEQELGYLIKMPIGICDAKLKNNAGLLKANIEQYAQSFKKY